MDKTEPPVFRPVLEGESGLTILPFGVIKFRETKAFWDKSLAAGRVAVSADSARNHRLHVTIGHELTHFIQSFTTAFVFKFAEDVRFLITQSVRYLAQGERPENLLPAVRKEYAEISGRMDLKEGTHKTSGRELMEDMAVLESIRFHFVQADAELIASEIPSDERYGNVIAILSDLMSPETVLRIGSTICFISLNTEHPGVAFSAITSHIATLPATKRDDLKALDIFSFFFADLSNTLISASARGEKISSWNTWNSVSYKFANISNIRMVHLIAANPSSLLAKSSWSEGISDDALRNSTPLLTYFSDGQGLGNPILEGNFKQYHDMVSLSGALLTLVEKPNVQPFVTCPVVDCPVKPTGLCHNHYPHPRGTSWKECSFPRLFQDVFRTDPWKIPASWAASVK